MAGKQKANDEMFFYHVLASMLLLLLFEKMKYLVWGLRWDFLSSKIRSHILAPPIQCRLDKDFTLLNKLSDSLSTLHIGVFFFNFMIKKRLGNIFSRGKKIN